MSKQMTPDDFFAGVPEDKRHALILHMSAGLVMQKGSEEGHENFVPCVAIKAGMTPWSDHSKEEEHVFIIDLRQALKLKRTIERTLEHLGPKGKETPEM